MLVLFQKVKMEESINDNKRDYDASLKQALVNAPNDDKNRIKKFMMR